MSVEECEAKDNYLRCERCTESVHRQLYDLHQMEDYCRGNLMFECKFFLINLLLNNILFLPQ